MNLESNSKELLYEKKSAWKGKKDQIFEFAERYKAFSANKTEREVAKYAIELAERKGYQDAGKITGKIKQGDKIFFNYRGKCVIFLKIGSEPLEKGLNITASHIDSPRIDLKASPLYEDSNLALLKTHYYGGIKKYQWATIPLSLRGVIYSKDGNKIEVSIGDNEGDPVFFISDLLIHLAQDQLNKKATDVITAEQLNVIAGSIPLDEGETKVKLNILGLLNEAYGINEESFLSAELEIVPAGKAYDVGFDKGAIAAYGHDDRSDSFAALSALLDSENAAGRTCCVILCDKEEIGSVGSTGLNSHLFDNIFSEALALTENGYSELALRRCLANSKVLSMDVTSAFDPSFPEAFDKLNTATFGNGSSVIKYTGSRGKSSSNDADSEYLQWLIGIFRENGIAYQTGEIGKVDQGGGGTVAYMLASYGAQTVDYGIPVLSMHAPYELISKADLYSCYEGAKAFFASI